ncbi:hypothetical protein FWP33_07710 [Vibrio parahaemolyticus]|uniref:hypothetical protein n=1 Tax=Vibrio jasicida TaxID=766224 RepID=UPI00391C28F8|nr:hypothetical protein [Vibrio parahaemolyticus]
MKNSDREKLNNPEFRKQQIGLNALIFTLASTFLIVLLGLMLYKGEITLLQISGVCAASIAFLSIVTHQSPLYWLKEFGPLYKQGLTYLLSLRR